VCPHRDTIAVHVDHRLNDLCGLNDVRDSVAVDINLADLSAGNGDSVGDAVTIDVDLGRHDVCHDDSVIGHGDVNLFNNVFNRHFVCGRLGRTIERGFHHVTSVSRGANRTLSPVSRPSMVGHPRPRADRLP